MSQKNNNPDEFTAEFTAPTPTPRVRTKPAAAKPVAPAKPAEPLKQDQQAQDVEPVKVEEPAPVPAVEPVKVEEPAPVPAVPLTSLSVSVPAAPLDNTYKPQHVEIRMTVQQRNALARVLAGLKAQGATLKSGMPVHKSSHVVMYLLENLHD
jgi:hypothetical protein